MDWLFYFGLLPVGIVGIGAIDGFYTLTYFDSLAKPVAHSS
jgi:hypothetical protein